MFTWTPIYKELAKALFEYRNRQPELISILEEIRKTGIPIIRLIDAPKPATEPKLATIDPFTFFACFNRGLTDQNRIGILKILKAKFRLNSEIPTDFSGIPVVDNMQSWFFPYPDKRKPDDVVKLWNLAESAIEKKPEQLDPQLFNRCLQIYTVGPAKMTMGMFWINPENYLALDEKNSKVFDSAGIDKRLKETNELTTKLPYSREEFGVPNNLYIIGTMNTADRSVEALDTALRRRFTFIEMRPNREKVTQPDGMKADLRKIFDVINARIERLHDADHCIGHAYFMGIKDLAGLRSVFANKIIPLLREYFYGNPAKVGMVLGERFVKRKTDNAPFATGTWGADELDEKEVFTFADPSNFSEEDFQTIYA